MTEHAETRFLPYTADLMYEVVADVEQYPKFLPWVMGLRVLSRSKEGGKDIVMAEMLVGYGALRERYTSRVVADPIARSIDVVQTEGPFRVLENHWRFAPRVEGSEVDFRIVFGFKNRMLQMVAGAAFERVLVKMADAFEARAKVLSETPDRQ